MVVAGKGYLFEFLFLARRKGLFAFVYGFGTTERVICLSLWFGTMEMVICVSVWLWHGRKIYSRSLEPLLYSSVGLRQRRDPERFYNELHDYDSPKNNIKLIWVGHVPQRGLIGDPEGTTQLGRRQCR